ncbi:uncharacterized protein [Primulina huaijiensis]|uniref:uncharacterized protein isoform X1 n=1 Tax=Primulina huaijiensis TaxID=1492673 RepID=UPI003CC77E1F
MFCPFPSRKTGSSWLNRLRTAKGFPENDAYDLEDFLQNPHSSSSDAPTPCPDKPPTFDSTKDEDLKLFNVICELFNFGDACCSSTKVKRFCRKQVNPRLCAFSDNGNAVIDNFDTEKTSANAASRSGDSYGGPEDLNESDERKDEGDWRDVDFPGFSRTEVTVIDTSYEQWKFEKLLLRKKNVWKVRDNKKTSEIWGSKKRRKLSGCIEDDRHAKKKHKVQDADGCGVWCEPPLNRVYHPSHKFEDHERAPEEVGKVLKMKQAELPSQELEKENSSVILIKGIPTSIKNRTSISKNCSKQIKP